MVSAAALPGLDVLGEARFVVLGQELVTTDVLEVEAYEILVVTFVTVANSCHDAFQGVG